jgi:hypothetical protein
VSSHLLSTRTCSTGENFLWHKLSEMGMGKVSPVASRTKRFREVIINFTSMLTQHPTHHHTIVHFAHTMADDSDHRFLVDVVPYWSYTKCPYCMSEIEHGDDLDQ